MNGHFRCSAGQEEAPDQRRQSQGHRGRGDAKMGCDPNCESGAPQAGRIKWPGAAFTDRETVRPYSPNLIVGRRSRPVLIQLGEIVTPSTVPVGGR
jgi:hypothetical protein